MYQYKIWDKKSPINGVSAKEVIKIHGINTAGAVGLVVDETGKAAVLQYDNANPMTEAALKDMLEKMTDEMNRPPAAEDSAETGENV